MNTSSSYTNTLNKESRIKFPNNNLDQSPDSDKFKEYCEKLLEYIMHSNLNKESREKLLDSNNGNNNNNLRDKEGKEFKKELELLRYLKYINLSTSKTKYQMKILDLGLIQKVLIPLMHLKAKKNSEIPKECCKIFINVSRNKNNHYKLSPEDLIFKELFSLISFYLNSEIISDILNILLYLTENKDFISKLSLNLTFIKKKNSDEINLVNHNITHYNSNNINVNTFIVEVNVGTITSILIEKYLDDLNSQNKILLLKIIFNLFDLKNTLMNKDSIEPIIRCLGDKDQECIVSALKIIFLFSQKIENNYDIIKSNFIFRIFRIYKYANLEINKILVKIILNLFSKQDYIDLLFKNNIILILENLFSSFEADQNEETVTTVFEIFKKTVDRLDKDLLFKLFSKALNFGLNSKNEIFVQSCLSTVDSVLKKNSKFILEKHSNKENIFESMHAFFKFKNYMIVQYSLSIFEIVLRKNFREFKKNYVVSNEKSLLIKTLIHHIINVINEFFQQDIVIKACKILKMLSKIPLIHGYFISEPQITIIRMFNEDIINKKNKVLKDINLKKSTVLTKNLYLNNIDIEDENNALNNNFSKNFNSNGKNFDSNEKQKKEKHLGVNNIAGNLFNKMANKRNSFKKSIDFSTLNNANNFFLGNNTKNINSENIFASAKNGPIKINTEINILNKMKFNKEFTVAEKINEDKTGNINCNDNYKISQTPSPNTPLSPNYNNNKNSNFAKFAEIAITKTQNKPNLYDENKLQNIPNSIPHKNLDKFRVSKNNLKIDEIDSDFKNKKLNINNSKSDKVSKNNAINTSPQTKNVNNNIIMFSGENNLKESPYNSPTNANSNLIQIRNKQKNSHYNSSCSTNNILKDIPNIELNGSKKGSIINNVNDKCNKNNINNLLNYQGLNYFKSDTTTKDNYQYNFNNSSINNIKTDIDINSMINSTIHFNKNINNTNISNLNKSGNPQKKISYKHSKNPRRIKKNDIDNFFIKKFIELEQLNEKLKISIEILSNLAKYSENADILTNKGFLEIINKMLIEENKDALSIIVKCVRGFCLSPKSIETILSYSMLNKILRILKICDRNSKILIFNDFRNILDSDVKLQKQFIIEKGISTIIGEVNETDDELNKVILRALYIISCNINKLFIAYYNNQKENDIINNFSDNSIESFSDINRLSDEEYKNISNSTKRKSSLLNNYKLKLQYIDSDSNMNPNYYNKNNCNNLSENINNNNQINPLRKSTNKDIQSQIMNKEFFNEDEEGNITMKKNSNYIIDGNTIKNNQKEDNFINYNLRKKVSNNENENNIPLINKYLNVENNNKNFLLDDDLRKPSSNSIYIKKESKNIDSDLTMIHGNFIKNEIKINKNITKTNIFTFNNIANQNVYGSNIKNLNKYQNINDINIINNCSFPNNNNISIQEKLNFMHKKSNKTIKTITGNSSIEVNNMDNNELGGDNNKQQAAPQAVNDQEDLNKRQLYMFKQELSRKTMMNKLLNIGILPNTSLETHKELIKILINLYLNRYYLKYFTRSSVFSNIMKIVEIIMNKSKNNEKESEMIKLILIFLKFICEEENLIRKFLDTTVISDIIHIINKNEYVSFIQNNSELEEFHYNLSLVLLRLSEFRTQSSKLNFLNKKFSVLEKLFEFNLFNGKIYIVNVIKNIATEKRDFFQEEDILHFLENLLNSQNSLLIYDTIDLLGALIFNRNLCRKMKNVFNFLINEIKCISYSSKFKNKVLEIILCLSYEKENIKGFNLSDFFHLFKNFEISINKKITLLILMNFSSIPSNFSYLTTVPGIFKDDANSAEFINCPNESTEGFFQKVEGNTITKNDIFNIINDLLDSDKFSQILIQRFLINITSMENIDLSIISQKVIDVLLEIVISNKNMQDGIVIFALAILVNLSNRNVIKVKNTCLTENFNQQYNSIDSNLKKIDSPSRRVSINKSKNKSLRNSFSLKNTSNISINSNVGEIKLKNRLSKQIITRYSIIKNDTQNENFEKDQIYNLQNIKIIEDYEKYKSKDKEDLLKDIIEERYDSKEYVFNNNEIKKENEKDSITNEFNPTFPNDSFDNCEFNIENKIFNPKKLEKVKIPKPEVEYFDLHIIDFILLRIYNIIDTMNDLFKRKNMDIISLAIMLACNLSKKLMATSNDLDEKISKCIEAFVLKESESKINILEFDSGKFFLIAIIKYCVCLSCDNKKVLNFLKLFEYVINKFFYDEELKNIKLKKEDYLNNTINFNLMESYLKFLNIIIESKELFQIFKNFFKESVIDIYFEFIKAFSDILNDPNIDQYFLPESNFQELIIIVLQILSTFMKVNMEQTEKLNFYINKILLKLIQFEPKKYNEELKSLFIFILSNLIDSKKKKKNSLSIKINNEQSELNKLNLNNTKEKNISNNKIVKESISNQIIEIEENKKKISNKSFTYEDKIGTNTIKYHEENTEEEKFIDIEKNETLIKWLINLFKIENNACYVDFYCLKMFLKNLKEENYSTSIWKSKVILKKLSKYLKNDNMISSKSNVLNESSISFSNENFMKELIKKIINYISFDNNSHINIIECGLYDDFKQMLFKKFNPWENEKITKDDVILLVNIFLNRENLNYLWEDMFNLLKIIFVCPEIIISIKIKLLDIFIYWNLFAKESKTFSEDYLVIFELIYFNIKSNFSEMIFLLEYFTTKYDEVSGRIIQNSKIIQKIYEDFLIFDKNFPSKLEEFYSFLKIIEKIIEQFDLDNSQINLNNLHSWNINTIKSYNLGISFLISENLISDMVNRIIKNTNTECLRDLTFLNVLFDILFSYLNKLRNFQCDDKFSSNSNDEEKMQFFCKKIDLNKLIEIAILNALEFIEISKIVYLENKENQKQTEENDLNKMKNEKTLLDKNSKYTCDIPVINNNDANSHHLYTNELNKLENKDPLTIHENLFAITNNDKINPNNQKIPYRISNLRVIKVEENEKINSNKIEEEKKLTNNNKNKLGKEDYNDIIISNMYNNENILRIDNISEIDNSNLNYSNVNKNLDLEKKPKMLFRLNKPSFKKKEELIDAKTDAEKEKLKNLFINPIKLNINDDKDNYSKYNKNMETKENLNEEEININNNNINSNDDISISNQLKFIRNFKEKDFNKDSTSNNLLEDLNPNNYIKSKSFVHLILRFFISEENKLIIKTLMNNNNYLFTKECFVKMTNVLIDKEQFEKKIVNSNVRITSQSILNMTTLNDEIDENEIRSIEDEIRNFLKNFDINDIMYILIFYTNTSIIVNLNNCEFISDYFIKLFNLIINKLIICYNIHMKNQKIFSCLLAKKKNSFNYSKSKGLSFKSEEVESLDLSNNSNKDDLKVKNFNEDREFIDYSKNKEYMENIQIDKNVKFIKFIFINDFFIEIFNSN